VEEEMLLFQSKKEIVQNIEHDWTIHDILRDPIYLSPEEESLYVRDGVKDALIIDFTDPDSESQWRDKLVTNDGPWEWYADNIEKDKFGLIANDINGGAHIAIKVAGGKHGLLEISFVVSYENFGISLAWVDNYQVNKLHTRCMITINDKEPMNSDMHRPQRLVGTWNEPASVPHVQLLHTNLIEGQKRFLHICLTPKGKRVQGEENKFKLLGVRLY
jgi:hypothetical protein